MEESITMYSTELIRKFPDIPEQPILYVVYNEQHIRDAETFIGMIHGEQYLKEHVTITTFNKPLTKGRDFSVYIDPMVYKYKHSWND
jgi:hypothetical protein